MKPTVGIIISVTKVRRHERLVIKTIEPMSITMFRRKTLKFVESVEDIVSQSAVKRDVTSPNKKRIKNHVRLGHV